MPKTNCLRRCVETTGMNKGANQRKSNIEPRERILTQEHRYPKVETEGSSGFCARRPVWLWSPDSALKADHDVGAYFCLVI